MCVEATILGRKSFVTDLPISSTGEEDTRQLEQLESLVWQPENDLSKKEIDQFLVIARSVGTFARALDCTSTVRQPSLHMSAAAASRDITLVSSHTVQAMVLVLQVTFTLSAVSYTHLTLPTKLSV